MIDPQPPAGFSLDLPAAEAPPDPLQATLPPGFTLDAAPTPIPSRPAPVSVMDIDKNLDRRSGAPLGVRLAVGGAAPQDKLPTLQRRYPEAVAYGDDNFAFVDPTSKRWTLYNPKGLDIAGDLASIVPEIAEYGGGILGGAVAAPGAIASAIPTMGASLLTVPAAVGLGAAGGREVENILAKTFAGRLDSRSPVQHLTDTAVTGGVNAVGGRLGELAEQGVKGVYGAFRGARPTAGLLQDYTAIGPRPGVTPMAGPVTGNRGTQIMEQALSNTPGGASVIQRAAQRTIDELSQATDDIAGQYGPTLTPQGAGAALRDSARNAAERFTARQDVIYDRAYNLIGRDSPAQIVNARRLAFEIGNEVDRAPQSLGPTANKALQQLANLMQDAQTTGGAVPFDALRRIRTNIGRDLDNPVLAGSTGAQNDYLRRVYGALSEDITAAARAAGPDAERALSVADRYTRRGMTQNIPILQKIIDQGTDEAAFKYAMSLAADGGTKLAQLRRNMQPQEWDVMAGTVLGRMGRSTPGNQGASEVGDAAESVFSPATFLTNWNKLAPEARTALFAGTRYENLTPALNSLVRVVDSVKDAGKMANPSGTARNLIAGAGLMAVGSDLMEGDMKGAGVTLGAGILAPHLTARLLTSPGFVRWLASAPSATATPNGVFAHLGRLAGVAKVEPEIRDAVDGYLQSLRGAPEADAAARQ